MSSTSAPKNKPRPDPDHIPIPPSSWAKKTGFRPKFSGETNIVPSLNPDLESGISPTQLGRLPPVQNEMGRAQTAQVEMGRAQKVQEGPARAQTAQVQDGPGRVQTTQGEVGRVQTGHGEMGRVQNVVAANGGGPGVKRREEVPGQQRSRRAERAVAEEDDGVVSRQMHMKYELRDSPGLVPIGFYGLQHFMSMLGSLILIPLVIVPAMGGSYEDTANVVSTVLFVSGLTTIIHTTFGSRLPLIQGPSFVYLAPALVIINSSEFIGLNGNNFRHIMKELQGAIIISSAFQALLGYSGLMTMFVRLINPVVVAPTIAAVGLSFYSYGFPRVGTCIEIGVVQILLVIIFSLYLRKISVFGNRVFLIYAVPLGLGITWAIAFLLTQAGAYNYKGCDINVPESNIISEHCRKHVARMKQCRVDTSHALNESPWFRFPYPLQWGMPVFNWKMALLMCVVSFISSVDSVGSYHASSLLVASRPPTPGVVSRGIGVEGLCSVLAGLWGTGTGSSTLTENVHTIAVTKMGSRRAVELGACVLIVLSLIGKVGGFIASIPEVMVAGLLCFMWAMLTALGLSNLRYSEAGSSRNIIIVGLSLFFSLSIPAYFQQYGISPNSNLPVLSYLQPYIVASHGPIRTQYGGLNYFINTVLSLHMVVAFLIAVILDNTVPGSKQERGVYVWSESEAARREPAVAKDYELPFRVGRVFRWVKWVGI